MRFIRQLRTGGAAHGSMGQSFRLLGPQIYIHEGPRVDESRTLIVSPIPRWFLYEVGGYDHRPPARFYTLWFFIMYSCMYVCIVSINMNKHVEYVFIHAYIYMYVCSIYLSICLPTYQSINLWIYQSVNQFINISMFCFLSIHLPIYLSICLST